jgi:hypothetical protein
MTEDESPDYLTVTTEWRLSKDDPCSKNGLIYNVPNAVDASLVKPVVREIDPAKIFEGWRIVWGHAK